MNIVNKDRPCETLLDNIVAILRNAILQSQSKGVSNSR